MATITGNSKANILKGKAAPDCIRGAGGDDALSGLDGNDRMFGGEGHDRVSGGDGNDTLYGDAGNDTLYGNAGNDRIEGGSGNDFEAGSAGNDKIYGNDGNDTLYGDAGNDLLSGGTGKDRLSGGIGKDTLYGGGGDDDLHGGSGDDYLNGGAGNDRLFGDAGHDTLIGGSGNDELHGGAGPARMRGDAGNDLLDYAQGVTSIFGDNWWLYENTEMDGGSGYDTLRITNFADADSTYPSTTYLAIDSEGSHLHFGQNLKNDYSSEWANYGIFRNIERFEFVGPGGVQFARIGITGSAEMTIIGTRADDDFTVSGGSNIIHGKGGADRFWSDGGANEFFGDDGNDQFIIFAGTSVVHSGDRDSDVISTTITKYDEYHISRATVTGFNGAAAAGGDRIEFSQTADSFNTLSVRENLAAGTTTFIWGGSPEAEQPSSSIITVDAIGLKADLDYFIL